MWHGRDAQPELLLLPPELPAAPPPLRRPLPRTHSDTDPDLRLRSHPRRGQPRCGCPRACPELVEGSRFWDLVQRPEEIQPPVQLLFPEDRASIQINLYRIAVAQAENRIDTRTANSMTWNQQVSMANLCRHPLIDAAPATARSTSSSRDDEDSDTSTPTSPSVQSPRPPRHPHARGRRNRAARRDPRGQRGRAHPPPPLPLPALRREVPQPAPRRAPPRLPVRPLRRSRGNRTAGIRAQGTGLRIQSRAQRSTLSHNSQRCHPERSTPRVRSRRICCY